MLMQLLLRCVNVITPSGQWNSSFLQGVGYCVVTSAGKRWFFTQLFDHIPWISNLLKIVAASMRFFITWKLSYHKSQYFKCSFSTIDDRPGHVIYAYEIIICKCIEFEWISPLGIVLCGVVVFGSNPCIFLVDDSTGAAV